MRRQQRRGSSAVQFALMLPMAAAAVALAVDGAYLYTSKAGSQAVADAAALAAGTAIYEEAAQVQAVQRAQRAVSVNSVLGTPLELPESSIEFGVWDFARAEFLTPAPAGVRTNAVRVEVVSLPVQPVFANLVGFSAMCPRATAIAVVETRVTGESGCGMVSGGDYLVQGNPLIDSYSIAAGAWDPVHNSGTQGHSCSNGSFQIGGDATISGDVHYGAGDDFIVHGASASWLRDSALWEDVPVEEVDCADARAHNDNALAAPFITEGRIGPHTTGWVFDEGTGAGGTITIPGGVYYLDDLTISSKTDLQILGPVTFCVDGDVDFMANSLTNAGLPAGILGDPRDFVIQVDSTGARTEDNGVVDFQANSATYAVIQAPGSEVKYQGNADFFGILIGAGVDHRGNAAIHVPEELARDYAPLAVPVALRLVR